MNRWVRVGIILHLCLLFTLLTGYAGYPFLHETLAYKTRLILYHEVMGQATPGVLDQGERLQRNRERFGALSVEEKDSVLDSYYDLQKLSRCSFWDKLKRSVKLLVQEIPPFGQAWFLFSLFICLLLLFRLAGAESAVWLLPLLAVCHLVYSSSSQGNIAESKEEFLFPSEAFILENYVQEPLKPAIFDQYAQLQKGWQLYVITEWAKEAPSNDLFLWGLQVERGEFAFNLARIQMLSENLLSGSLAFRQHPSSLEALLQLVWNCFFATLVNYKFFTLKRLHAFTYRPTRT